MTPDLIAYDMVKRGKLTESLEYLDDAIDKSIGDLLKLYENRAYVYINLGDNEKAIKDVSIDYIVLVLKIVNYRFDA